MTCKDAGLTLVELLASLAIAAVMLAIGLPAFSGSLERNRVSTSLHRLTTDLAMARNTAVMRRAQVIVCPRTADLRCREDGDWSHGWMVFADNDGNRQPDEAGDIIRSTDAPGNRDLAIGSSRAFLRYQRDGRSAHSNQTIRVCAGERLAGSVVINNVGRVRSARPAKPTTCPQT